MSKSTKATVKECLLVIFADDIGDFDADGDIETQFKQIKTKFFKMALIHHPDKGGDHEVFTQLQSSFEVLREMKAEGHIRTYSFAAKTKEKYQAAYTTFNSASFNAPDYSYYADAALDEDQPAMYIVERAKSGRSKCNNKAKGNPCPYESSGRHIEKDELRIGTFLPDIGGYTYFRHLCCWRVPARIWNCLIPILGGPHELAIMDEGMDVDTATDFPNGNSSSLIPFSASSKTSGSGSSSSLIVSKKQQVRMALYYMDEVLLTGMSSLSWEEQSDIIDHVMDKSHWARDNKSRKAPMPVFDRVPTQVMIGPGEITDRPGAEGPTDSSSSSQAMRVKKEKYVRPEPGVNGALSGALKGCTVVMSGIFPEVGGGFGLELGKNRMKDILKSFGARVTSSVTGKTTFLMVGQQPGAGTVMEARRRGLVFVDSRDLKLSLESGDFDSFFEDLKRHQVEHPKRIPVFSAGFRGNAKVLTKDEFRISNGETNLKIKSKATKSTAKSSGKSSSSVQQLEWTETLTCDECGKDVTSRSFYVADSESDYCFDCIPEGDTYTEQTGGEDIPGAVKTVKSTLVTVKKSKIGRPAKLLSLSEVKALASPSTSPTSKAKAKTSKAKAAKTSVSKSKGRLSVSKVMESEPTRVSKRVHKVKSFGEYFEE